MLNVSIDPQYTCERLWMHSPKPFVLGLYYLHIDNDKITRNKYTFKYRQFVQLHLTGEPYFKHQMKSNHHILVDKPLPQKQSPRFAQAKSTAGSLDEVSWNLTLGDSCVHQDRKQNHRYGDHFQYESRESKDTFHSLHTFPHPTKSRTPQQHDCLLPTAASSPSVDSASQRINPNLRVWIKKLKVLQCWCPHTCLGDKFSSHLRKTSSERISTAALTLVHQGMSRKESLWKSFVTCNSHSHLAEQTASSQIWSSRSVCASAVLCFRLPVRLPVLKAMRKPSFQIARSVLSDWLRNALRCHASPTNPNTTESCILRRPQNQVWMTEWLATH